MASCINLNGYKKARYSWKAVFAKRRSASSGSKDLKGGTNRDFGSKNIFEMDSNALRSIGFKEVQ
jgi:hypothetical protein